MMQSLSSTEISCSTQSLSLLILFTSRSARQFLAVQCPFKSITCQTQSCQNFSAYQFFLPSSNLSLFFSVNYPVNETVFTLPSTCPYNHSCNSLFDYVFLSRYVEWNILFFPASVQQITMVIAVNMAWHQLLMSCLLRHITQTDRSPNSVLPSTSHPSAL